MILTTIRMHPSIELYKEAFEQVVEEFVKRYYTDEDGEAYDYYIVS